MGGHVEQQVGIARRQKPAVARHLAFQLPGAPPGMAKRDEIRRLRERALINAA